MIKRFVTWSALATALLSAPAWATDTYKVDVDHTTVQFTATHMMVSEVRGVFESFEGTIKFDPTNITQSSAEGSIDVASLNTRNKKRDEHLRSADFFDVATHPKITFHTTAIRKAGDKLVAAGELTIRGVTRPVEMPITIRGPVKDPWGATRIGFSTELTVNRKDFGLNWSKTMDNGGLVVGDIVKINLDVEAVKQ